MKIYTKILVATLPLVLLALLAGAGTTYYLSRNALTLLAENWLETRLSEAVQAVAEHEEILHRYDLENVAASVKQAQNDASTAMWSIQIGEQGYVFAVNSQGIVAAHPNEQLVNSDVSGEDWFREMKGNQRGQLAYAWQGINHLAVYEHFQPWDWYVVVTDPQSEVYGAVNQTGTYVLILGVSGSVVMALLLMFLTRRLTLPVNDLANGARRVTQGQLDHAVPVRSRDELGLLAQAFNRMIARLRQALADLEQEIAERKRAEDELRRHRDHLEELVTERTARLEAANTELSQYAYIVSHDLRAPLRAVRNYADFLREDLEGTLNGEQKAYLDGLGRAVHEAEDLIGDLLKLSRLDRHNVQMETVDLGLFLRELIASLDLPAEVETVMGDDWPTLNVEPTLLRQIFQNLIDNAVKFNDSPRKRVELGWRPAEEGYELFVRDNGIGIEPRYQAQIFRMFERLHIWEEYEGTGIGLAIVKKAAGKLGSSVRLESQPGQGSTFFVTLPKTSSLGKK
jgi:signal transduction histidine kinase